MQGHRRTQLHSSSKSSINPLPGCCCFGAKPTRLSDCAGHNRAYLQAPSVLRVWQVTLEAVRAVLPQLLQLCVVGVRVGQEHVAASLVRKLQGEKAYRLGVLNPHRCEYSSSAVGLTWGHPTRNVRLFNEQPHKCTTNGWSWVTPC